MLNLLAWDSFAKCDWYHQTSYIFASIAWCWKHFPSCWSLVCHRLNTKDRRANTRLRAIMTKNVRCVHELVTVGLVAWLRVELTCADPDPAVDCCLALFWNRFTTKNGPFRKVWFMIFSKTIFYLFMSVTLSEPGASPSMQKTPSGPSNGIYPPSCHLFKSRDFFMVCTLMYSAP